MNLLITRAGTSRPPADPVPRFTDSGKLAARFPEIHVVDGIPRDGAPLADHGGGPAVYEVIRLVDGIPLFFEEHLDRMRRSVAGITDGERRISATDEEIRSWIRAMMDPAAKIRINVRLLWSFPENREKFVVAFIPSHYPGPDAYAHGVSVVTYQGERRQPGLKTLGDSFKERVRRLLEETGAWEALLMGRDGAISEGSRSNVFFLHGNELLTPPAGTVLMGVTRAHVLAICRERGIRVREERIREPDLAAMDGLFLTGTSVDVLPVASVDGRAFASPDHPLVRTLLAAYREKARDYLRGRMP